MARFVTDQTGRSVTVSDKPLRIISLVPSQTELLHYLGLGDRVVGITRFCIHPPEWFRSKPRVGGTKQVDADRIHSLQPDLILANQEENTREEILSLAAHYPVWVSDVRTWDDCLAMIQQVGALTATEEKADDLVAALTASHKRWVKLPPRRVLYLIWRRPWMGVGSETFIHAIMQESGVVNVLAADKRYPELSEEAIKALKPDEVWLSSEPFPFRDQHVAELRTMLPAATIRLVDGGLFSWYGPRMLQLQSYLPTLL